MKNKNGEVVVIDLQPGEELIPGVGTYRCSWCGAIWYCAPRLAHGAPCTTCLIVGMIDENRGGNDEQKKIR